MSLALYRLMLQSASCLTFRTHFDPTLLASFGGGTNSHVSLLINELYSASKTSFHSFESLPPRLLSKIVVLHSQQLKILI